MTSPASAPTPNPTPACPACHAPASGKFCSNCGAPLAGAQCAACGTDLTPGSKFCHRCGTAAGAKADQPITIGNADRGIGSALPWAVAAIALVALIALVAGQRFSRSSVTAAPAPTDLPAASQSGSPPDISQMTPQERAERLYDRVMALNERGRADSVRFFAPMAMQAYTMLGRLNTDQRYDLGRIAAVSGDEQTARAQADTILSTQPQHLLGLLLAADAARLRGEQTREATYLRRFMAAAPAERAKQLPEYQQHVAEIDARLEKIRSR